VAAATAAVATAATAAADALAEATPEAATCSLRRATALERILGGWSSRIVVGSRTRKDLR
jgi:hypothetical protein